MRRPGVEEFLAIMSKYYEIIAYTASLPTYADPLLDLIDPLKFISYRLFREHCTFYKNAFIKDLSKLGWDLKDVIIVDNCPAAYFFQPENGIPIPTWIDDIDDRKLFELCLLLEPLSYINDVRDVIKKYVKTESIDYVKVAKQIAKMVPIKVRDRKSVV